MAEANEGQRDEAARPKKYARPTLTEYGSVAKLTMTKGNTTIETPTQQMSCL